MTKSVYRRHFFLTAGMILLSFALLGASFMVLSYRYTIQEKKDALTTDATYVAELTGRMIDAGLGLGNENFTVYLSAISAVTDADVTICDVSGQVICSCSRDPKTDQVQVGETISSSVLNEVTQNGGYLGMSDAGVFDAMRFVVGKPITALASGGAMVGLVLVSSNPSGLTELWRSFASIFFFTAVVVLVVAFISSLLTTRQQTRPIKEIADVVRRFGMGEFDLRAKDYGRTDEVGELAVAFNAMADSIASSEQRRQEFVANISHELKTPMTTIAGFTDGILDGTVPPEKQEESLRVVSAETRRLSRLVRQMLDMSQLQAKETTVLSQSQFDIVEAMARVLISLEGKINARKLDVDAHFPDGAAMVWGDPDSVTQVCYNLVDNAIKFSTPGTAIGIAITTHDGKAWVSVRNHGETIPPEELTMIFDRFHKSDRSRSLDKEGVGLGLYIVKSILNSLKESITVTSQEGVTEFVFTLTTVE